MLFGQVGMGGLGAGIPYAVADTFVSYTSMFGLALGLLALLTSFIDCRREGLIVYSALGAMGCVVAYFVWWAGLGVVPTGWPAILMTGGSALSGAWAIWRHARHPPNEGH